MGNITNEFVAQHLSANFGNTLAITEVPNSILTVETAKENIIEVLRYLKENEELKFDFLTDLTAVHYPEKEQNLVVVYHLNSFKNRLRIKVKTAVSTQSPNLPSATILWNGANWMERETYDFFGIIFDGHPDLRRILNVDEMTVFPMRKEYPLEDPNRVDKKDYFFGR